MNRKKIYPLYLALIPAVVFFIFFIVPSTVGYYYAFTNWSAARTTNLKFVGFENIMSVLTSTKVPVAFVNTLIYAGVKTITVTLLGFVFAYILNREIKTRTALRTVYFIPSIFSCLVVGLIFSAVFQTRHGTINNILNLMGIANIQWLGKRGTAVFAICVAEVWRNVGYAIIITLAGLQSVSSDYLEAGKVQAIVAQPLYDEAYKTMEYLDTIFRGGTVPEWTDLEAPVVTKDGEGKNGLAYHRDIAKQVEEFFQ